MHHPDAKTLWKAPQGALAVLLATASLCKMGVGLVAWIVVHRIWPAIGRAVAEQ